jgi:TonB family protein
MEGAAGSGPSPFAAGTVKNDYIGGKVGLDAYRWYTDQIDSRIEEALGAQKELAKAQYSVVVHIWLARDGKVERAELQGSTGDKAIDKLISKALTGMGSIAEAPPEDMPQPVKLRITSKIAG